MTLSDDRLRECVALLAEHGTIRKAADAAGVKKSAFHARIKRAAERGLMGSKPVLPGFVIKSVASKAEDGAWLKQTKAPGKAFTAPEGHEVKGVSALVDAEGRELLKWVKTGAVSKTETFLDAIRFAFDSYQGRAELVPSPPLTDDDLLSVYPIADAHNGLLAWGRETGEAYDLKIGADRLRSCAARLVGQSPASGTALILNLGDWTHQDDSRNATPRSGHVLDVDGRYFKVLVTGVQLMQDVIELALQKHAHVIVRNVPGNHDPHASIALTVALSAFYAGNPRVTIDDDPSDWFFMRFGETLLGANHGHKAKPTDMAMTMAVRRREDWGSTRFHYFYFGHIHHETAKEVGDVRCESFQTLAAKDAHAHSGGYNSGQSLTSITIHRQRGEIGRHRVNLAPGSTLARAA